MHRPSDLTKYFGGLFRRLYAKKITPPDATTEMNRVLGGSQCYWQRPPSTKQERVLRALARGGGTHAVATRYGISDRHVRRLKKRLESE